MNRTGILKIAAQKKIGADTIEKDYVLSLALSVLSKTVFTNKLFFKGGTAIKKAHYPEDARFSLDLDFNLFDISQETVEQLLTDLFVNKKICDIQFHELKSIGRTPATPRYKLFYTGPLNSKYSIRFDFMEREKPTKKAARFNLELTYPDAIFQCGYLEEQTSTTDPRYKCELKRTTTQIKDCITCEAYVQNTGKTKANHMWVMDIEEIFAEKIRTILDPRRVQARDLYDIWFLLIKKHVPVMPYQRKRGDEYRVGIDISLLNKKLELINKTFDYGEFCENVDKITKEDWNRDLNLLLPQPLPDYKKTVEDVKNEIKRRIKNQQSIYKKKYKTKAT